jgi:hypothetical protein
MNTDLFDYEMKRKGYRSSKQRADAMGISLSAYYSRINNRTECSLAEMERIAELLGWEVTKRIFFGDKVS